MGELTDLMASLLGKLGRYLNIKGRRACFVLWGCVMLYWMVRNYTLGLKVQTASCLFSLAMDAWGWWNWKHEKIGK